MVKSIISIEGNIGAGKSTLIKKLKEINDNDKNSNITFSVFTHIIIHVLCIKVTYMINSLQFSIICLIMYSAVVLFTYYNISYLLENRKQKVNIVFLEEPINEWTKITETKTGRNIFEKYCADQNKYGFVFQMLCLKTRIKMLWDAISENPPDTIIVCERSIFTDANVFAKMLFHTAKMNEIEYKVYREWYEWVISEIPTIQHIYLYSDPISSKNRKEIRNRRGEENIDDNYMRLLHRYHEIAFCGGGGGDSSNANVIMKINIDLYPITDTIRYNSIATKILKVIKQEKN